MSGKDAVFCAGAVGLVILALSLLKFWSNWRKRALTEAGEAFGFKRIRPGETLPIALVPLISEPNCAYFVILQGKVAGQEAAFFDLYCTAGKSWDYQSTLAIRFPLLTIPEFQLQTEQWLQAHQRNCGMPLTIAGREKDMVSLRLSSEDPDWARDIFSVAPPKLFEHVKQGRWTVEGFQHSIIVYRWGTRIPPRNLKNYVKEAGEIAMLAVSVVNPGSGVTVKVRPPIE